MWTRRVASNLFRPRTAAVALAFSATLLSFRTPVIRADAGLKEQEDEETAFSQWKADTVREYENRLRAFSHPYKVFHYFASVVIACRSASLVSP